MYTSERNVKVDFASARQESVLTETFSYEFPIIPVHEFLIGL